MKEYFLLIFIGHILGDFYVQTQNISIKKNKGFKWVLFHGLLYFFAVFLVSIPVMSIEIFFVVLFTSLLHLIVDGIKYAYIKKIENINERNIFLIDQLLHIILILATVYFMFKIGIVMKELEIFKDLFNSFGISEIQFASWFFGLLLIHKPANILIQKIISLYKPIDNDEESGKDMKAGRLIGTIERIIMFIFISIGQYAAIGLVLTAKSIARYDRISKDKNFAEYYLLGTLLSTLIVIVTSYCL